MMILFFSKAALRYTLCCTHGACHVTMATAPAFGTTAGCKSGFAEQCMPPDKLQMLEAGAFLWFLTVLGLLPDCADLPEQQRVLSLRTARFEHLL